MNYSLQVEFHHELHELFLCGPLPQLLKYLNSTQNSGWQIARPLNLHYNHYVSPSVRYELVKMLISIEPHGLF